MAKRWYIILVGAIGVAALIVGALVLVRNISPATPSETLRVVPPIEDRITTLDTLGETGANASTSVQAPEEKLQTLEALSAQQTSSQSAADSPTAASPSAAPAPDTSAKLDVLRSMRGQ